ERAVLRDVETRAQTIDRTQHLIGVTALLALARAPLGFFGIAPRYAGRTDCIESHGCHRIAQLQTRPETLSLRARRPARCEMTGITTNQVRIFLAPWIRSCPRPLLCFR